MVLIRRRVLSIFLVPALVCFSFQNCAPTHTGGSSSQLSSTSADEVSLAFEKTLQPILLANCIGCHGVSQQPMFAVSDPFTATQTILVNNLADLKTPSQSRFISKIMGGHNGFPTSLASDIEAAIVAWSNLLKLNPSVDIIAPVVNLLSPTAGTIIASGSVTVSASATDNVGVSSVKFLRNGVEFAVDTQAPYSTSINSSTLGNGIYQLSAVATDAAGNMTTSSSVSLEIKKIVAPGGDTTPPSVLITSHLIGSSVVGTVAVTASASDAVGVVGVQFFVDGVALGAEDTSAPYSVNWNSTAFSNGTHALSAQARDLAGNVATSTSVNVMVSNAPPVVTFSYISANILVSCTGCHNSGSKTAGYSYSNYADTMKSVIAGNPSSSKFYSTIKSGSMPKGSGKMSASKIQSVSDWIAAGALNN